MGLPMPLNEELQLFLDTNKLGPEEKSANVSRGGRSFEWRSCQQILGSCSPLSMSTTAVAADAALQDDGAAGSLFHFADSD